MIRANTLAELQAKTTNALDKLAGQVTGGTLSLPDFMQKANEVLDMNFETSRGIKIPASVQSIIEEDGVRYAELTICMKVPLTKCRCCGNEFPQFRKNRVFCSHSCQSTYGNRRFRAKAKITALSEIKKQTKSEHFEVK